MQDELQVLYKEEFELDFEEIYNYILINSDKNAQKFVSELRITIQRIIKNPEAGTLENRIDSKENNYRYKILMKSWKLIYKLTRTELIFLSIIHVKRGPESYNNLKSR